MSVQKIKTAIILAAGKGTRLDNVTKGEYPKPLTPIDGVPIIERSIQALKGQGIERILLGCGHMIESFTYLIEKYQGVEIVENPEFDTLGSLSTLMIFEGLVREEFYLLEADIIYDPKAISFLENNRGKGNGILTSNTVPLEDNVFYHSENSILQKLSKENPKERIEGVMTGIWAFSKGFMDRFGAFCMEENINLDSDYEIALARYSAKKEPIKTIHLDGLNWCEIDNEDHYQYAVERVWPRIRDRY